MSALKLVLSGLAEGAAGTLLLATSGHHNFWGFFDRADAGDRLPRWKPADRLPVIFCHGYMGDATNFVLLRRRLFTSGFRSQATVWLRPFWRPCSEYARLIDERVRDVLRRTGAPAVDLVAHSMGGLASRRYLAHPGRASSVRRLVTIGTPHRGTIFAHAGVGACAEDLRPGSALLSELDGDLEQLAPRKVLSIHGDLDLIAQPSTARVPAPQENLLIQGLGHSSLLCSRRVHRAIRASLTPVTGRFDLPWEAVPRAWKLEAPVAVGCR